LLNRRFQQHVFATATAIFVHEKDLGLRRFYFPILHKTTHNTTQHPQNMPAKSVAAKSVAARKKTCDREGKRLSKAPAAKRKGVCVKKRKLNPAMSKWMRAAKAEGYMVKGAAFKPLPKKGSAGYLAIMRRVNNSK